MLLDAAPLTSTCLPLPLPPALPSPPPGRPAVRVGPPSVAHLHAREPGRDAPRGLPYLCARAGAGHSLPPRPPHGPRLTHPGARCVGVPSLAVGWWYTSSSRRTGCSSTMHCCACLRLGRYDGFELPGSTANRRSMQARCVVSAHTNTRPRVTPRAPLRLVPLLPAGTRSIQILYRAIIFTFTPTMVELVAVCCLLASRFGPALAGVVGATFVAYVTWSVAMTQVSGAVGAGWVAGWVGWVGTSAVRLGAVTPAGVVGRPEGLLRPPPVVEPAGPGGQGTSCVWRKARYWPLTCPCTFVQLSLARVAWWRHWRWLVSRPPLRCARR